MSGGMLKEVSDQNFSEEVLNSKGLVLVDFWAPWCGPCRMVAPILEELSADMGDKVKIMKMNVDDNPFIPSQMAISSIPALMLFKDGTMVDVKVGVSPKESLKAWISSH